MAVVLIAAAARKTPPGSAEAVARARRKLAEAMAPGTARSFAQAMEALRRAARGRDLVAAVAAGSGGEVPAAVLALLGGEAALREALGAESDLGRRLRRTTAEAARLEAAVLERMGFGAPDLAAVDRAAVWYARDQSAALVRGITAETRAAIQVILEAGQALRLTPVQLAEAIRHTVGLPATWATAPYHFARELERGIVSRRRLLYDPIAEAPTPRRRRRPSALELMLREGIAAGRHRDSAWVARMTERYRTNLLHRRALNIARTESIRAANQGALAAWRTGLNDGSLPDQLVRKVVVVTPDERLRAAHLNLAVRYRDGLPVNEPFDTPWGELDGPPWEPNCRCVLVLKVVRATETPDAAAAAEEDLFDLAGAEADVIPAFRGSETSGVSEGPDLPDADEFAHQVAQNMLEELGGSQPLTLAQAREFVDTVTTRWGESTTSEEAYLLQRAVQQVFGLKNVAPPTCESEASALRRWEDASVRRQYEAYVRAQYRAIQRYFAARGIDRVSVIRGWRPPAEAALPPDRQGFAARQIKFRPLSSFTTKGLIAMNFGPEMMVARIPARLVFSFMKRGPGTEWEREVVVIGGKYKVATARTSHLVREIREHGTLWPDLLEQGTKAFDKPGKRKRSPGQASQRLHQGAAASGGSTGVAENDVNAQWLRDPPDRLDAARVWSWYEMMRAAGFRFAESEEAEYPRWAEFIRWIRESGGRPPYPRPAETGAEEGAGR